MALLLLGVGLFAAPYLLYWLFGRNKDVKSD
jgi:hypothetical protein